MKSRIRSVPRPMLLSILLVCALISLIALRSNNENMIKLRNQLYAADKSNGNVNGALNNLRTYVYGHMNTDLSSGNSTIKPPIQLKYTYERLQTTAAADVEKANTQLYTDAENYCQVTVPNGYYGAYRIPCVQDYLSKHSLQALPKPISPAQYEFDFASPSWSPDFAGWSLVVCVILLIIYLISAGYQLLFQRSRTHRRRS